MNMSDPNSLGGPSAGSANADAPGPGGEFDDDTEDDDALPPEIEQDLSFELPQAGERYVFSANPESNSVAVIDADTLAIHSVEAGDKPTYLQTLAGRDEVIVLNVGSNDATVIRTSEGISTTSTLKVQRGANAIAVAPDGKHAVVYFDVNRSSTGASGSFQDLSVLFLEPGDDRSVAMTVGFRPRQVAFTTDGSRAFVVTEDGISILDFAEINQRGPYIARTVPLGTDPSDQALDVSVTPDGRYALARQEGESQLRLVNLQSGAQHGLDLQSYFRAEAPNTPADADAGAEIPPTVPPPAAVTDVDLAPTGDYALAVVRDRSAVIKLPIPQAFQESTEAEVIQIGNEVIGQAVLSPDGQRALLFTTALAENERISLLDVESGNFDVVRLPKSVEAVTIAPNSRTALIVHRKLPGDPTEPGLMPDLVIDRSYGYSVLDFDSRFSKLQITEGPVGPSAVVPDGSHLFVLFNSPQIDLREVHRVPLQSFLVERIVLGSPPTSIGSVPRSGKVFVGQSHAEGRITFVDWSSGQTESVTGFELNSRIRQ